MASREPCISTTDGSYSQENAGSKTFGSSASSNTVHNDFLDKGRQTPTSTSRHLPPSPPLTISPTSSREVDLKGERDEDAPSRGRLLGRMIEAQRPGRRRARTPAQIFGTNLRSLILVEREFARRKKIEEDRRFEESRMNEGQRLASAQPPACGSIWKGLKDLVLSERLAEEKRHAEMHRRLHRPRVLDFSDGTSTQDQQVEVQPISRSGKFSIQFTGRRTAEMGTGDNFLHEEQGPSPGTNASDKTSRLPRPPLAEAHSPSRLPRPSLKR